MIMSEEICTVPTLSNSRNTLAFVSAPVIELESVAASKPSRVDDFRLIRAAQQGDTSAFEELVRLYDRPVLRLAMHITGSQEDAQDIYQEAFLRAYMNLASFRFECSFYTWMYRIVTNLCLDHLRKKSSRQRDVTTTISPEGEEEAVVVRMPDRSAASNPERSVISREVRQSIIRALRRLSPRERVVFELKHYHGMRLRTVAGILRTTDGTIKNTLFRATHKLRIELAEVR